MVLGTVCQRPKIRRLVICSGQRINGARLGATRADNGGLWQLIEQRSILLHELRRPRHAVDVLGNTVLTKPHPALAALTVSAPAAIFRKSTPVSSHGLQSFPFRPYTWPLQEGAKLRAVAAAISQNYVPWIFRYI